MSIPCARCGEQFERPSELFLHLMDHQECIEANKNAGRRISK